MVMNKKTMKRMSLPAILFMVGYGLYIMVSSLYLLRYVTLVIP